MQTKNNLTHTIQPLQLHKKASQQIQTQHPSRPWILAKALVSHLPLVLLLWSTCWLLTGCKRPYSSLVQESPALGSCYMLNTHVLTVESSDETFKQFFEEHQAQDIWHWICFCRQYACLAYMDEIILDTDYKISNILSKREPKDRAELKDAIITYMHHIKRDTAHMNQETVFWDLLHANALNEIWDKLNQAKGQDTLDLSGMLQGRSEALQIEVLKGVVQFIRKHCPKLVELNLSFNGLTALPDTFGDLINLNELDLSGNELDVLPDTFGNLTNLNELDLSDNDLSVLPNTFGDLRQLQMLHLNNNQLTALPNSFAQLINLNELDLSDNQLTELPKSLLNLTQLKKLDLHANYLKALPDNFENLTQVQILDLSNNELEVLPDTLLNLTQLQELHLSDNPLTVLPDFLSNFTQLQKLHLSDNPLTPLPAYLLDLTQLQIYLYKTS